MKKSLLIASALVVIISCPVLAQETKSYQPPTVEKLTFQQSLQRDRSAVHHHTQMKPFSVPGTEIWSKHDDDSRPSDLKGRRQPRRHGYQSIETPRFFVEKDPSEFVLYSMEGVNPN
jgi:hypothetical protein